MVLKITSLSARNSEIGRICNYADEIVTILANMNIWIDIVQILNSFLTIYFKIFSSRISRYTCAVNYIVATNFPANNIGGVQLLALYRLAIGNRLD